MGAGAFRILNRAPANAVRQLSPRAVREHLADGDGQLLDVREAWERAQVRLPADLWIPIAELPSRLRELDGTRTLIVYCHHGIRSWHAACFLQLHGHANVINLAGGIDAWSREIDPDLARY